MPRSTSPSPRGVDRLPIHALGAGIELSMDSAATLVNPSYNALDRSSSGATLVDLNGIQPEESEDNLGREDIAALTPRANAPDAALPRSNRIWDFNHPNTLQRSNRIWDFGVVQPVDDVEADDDDLGEPLDIPVGENIYHYLEIRGLAGLNARRAASVNDLPDHLRHADSHGGLLQRRARSFPLGSHPEYPGFETLDQAFDSLLDRYATVQPVHFVQHPPALHARHESSDADDDCEGDDWSDTVTATPTPPSRDGQPVHQAPVSVGGDDDIHNWQLQTIPPMPPTPRLRPVQPHFGTHFSAAIPTPMLPLPAVPATYFAGVYGLRGAFAPGYVFKRGSNAFFGSR